MDTPGAPPKEPVASVSIESLRMAFGLGSPTAVYNALIPFLQQESRSNGDTRVINEIAETISKLVHVWLPNSEMMRSEEQRMLYALLRPSGHLVDTLLQYHVLQRQRGAAVGLGVGTVDGAALLTIPLHNLPAEYSAAPNMEAMRATRLPAEFFRRAIASGGFGVNALELFIYNIVKALAAPQEASGRGASSVVAYTPKSPGLPRSGSSAGNHVAYSLAREYIGFFVPVAVPEKLPPARSDSGAERSPMKHIRDRLHDLSHAKALSGATDQHDRKPGTIDVDLLDRCDYNQALELASFFVACAVVQWLPAIPVKVVAAARMPDAALDKGDWMWVPGSAQLSALHLFHALVGYVAKGERQMERYHLAGDAGCNSEGPDAAVSERETHAKRINMNGTVRDTLRARNLTAAIGDTLGLVLTSCARAGVSDSEIWIPFLDVTASIWIRYVMPWRGAKAEPVSNAAEISSLWQSRIPLMMKGLSPALYGQTLALFMRQVLSPNVDLLAHTASVLRGSSAGAGHGVQTWIHDAVSSVFGHPLTMDVLAVIDRVASAFAAPDLRAILAAVERCQLDAYPRLREQMASPPPQFDPSGLGSNLALQTPTKRAPISLRLPDNRAENASFDMQITAAQKLLLPYIQDIASCRSGSPILDSAMAVLGRPPVCLVFGLEPSTLLGDAVRMLHGAEVLAERQLRLIVPEGSADQARSIVSDIFLVLSRLFAATDDGSSWGRNDYPGMSGNASETMRVRAQSLHEAQARIRTLYARLAVVFHATRRDIDAIKEMQDDAAISSAGGHDTGGLRPFGASSGFGERLAARGRHGDVATPDMEHGSLTPRGRWELKTGRKKFTAQSLLASPQGSQQSPPQWHLQARRAATVADESLQPRGPRAQLQARSYESQWLLDRIRVFNVWANRRYQQLLDIVDAGVFPVPSSMRAHELDFRWAAAYPNIRFMLLVLIVLRIVFWLF